jgi:hypothetical protein
VIGVLLFVVSACSSSNASNPDSSSRPSNGAASGEPVDVGALTRAAAKHGALVLETTSTRARFVSGGDVLVTVSGPDARRATVTTDGKDMTGAFATAGHVRRGLIANLTDGVHTIVATSGHTAVRLRIVNHSKNGPVLSGPHLEPWVCTTQAAGLGPATDADCDAPTKVTWSYKSTGGLVKPVPDPTDLPTDVARATVRGASVPFVIRTERGVIDRGVYTIWSLDPHPSNSTGSSWDPSGWNGRLVYRFGGGCGTQYSQGSSFVDSADTSLLGAGYAVATNTLDTYQTACNSVLSAEAALMTREHFVEAYGVPDFTIGDGGSGGAIQQLTIAHAYPGILDALSPSLPFPDAVSIAAGVTDCGLLVHYYATPAGQKLTEAQRIAINGHRTTGTCQMWNQLFVGGVNPTDGCDAIGKQVYDPVTNPHGARCTLADMNVNILGRDPKTSFANRPLDSVGVQYGYAALRAGVLGVDQFLDLNAGIGGYDIDGNIVPQRAQISADVAAIPNRVGGVIEPGPLQDIPIILRNIYTDPIGDIHTRFHAFSIRDRLRENGRDDPNLVLWTSPSGDIVQQLLGNTPNANEPIMLLDQWLTTGKKPAAAVNRCTLPNGGPTLTGGWELYDRPGPCASAYPIKGDPRTAAGAPQRDDIVKCALRPVEAGAYEVAFTAAQAARLRQIFPEGVCDWSQPGVGSHAKLRTWQVYG